MSYHAVIVGGRCAGAPLARFLARAGKRVVPPFKAFSPGEIVRWTVGSVLRGRFGVVRPFFTAARRSIAIERELQRRCDLLTPALPAAVH